MKAFILSTAAIVILVVIWGGYVNYTHHHIIELADTIEESILISIAEDDWNSALSDFKGLTKKWQKQKNVYSFFVDTNTLNQTDFTIARAEAYLKAQNYALAAGELSHVKEQLLLLHTNELITLENLF